MTLAKHAYDCYAVVIPLAAHQFKVLTIHPKYDAALVSHICGTIFLPCSVTTALLILTGPSLSYAKLNDSEELFYISNRAILQQNGSERYFGKGIWAVDYTTVYTM